MSEQRDAAADLAVCDAAVSDTEWTSAEDIQFADFCCVALPYWIREAERLRGENERLGIQITGMEIQMHGLRAALEACEEEEL